MQAIFSFTNLLIVWGAVTAVLLAMFIYRSILVTKEDDQLFLEQTETPLERDQIEIRSKLNKVSPYIRKLGTASGVLAALIIGLYVRQAYQAFSQGTPLP